MALDLPDGWQEIGEFSVELDEEAVVFASSIDPHNTSDLSYTNRFDTKTYTLAGSSGINTGGAPSTPTLELTLMESKWTDGVVLISVTLIDDSTYKTALTANEDLYGSLSFDSIEIGDDGTVSLSFAADLVRVDMLSEQPIAGQPGAHIEGSFSGKIPASELE